MLRESGFYWVKFYYNEWTIGEWISYDNDSDGYHWNLIGSDDVFYDNEFEEIGPRITKD